VIGKIIRESLDGCSGENGGDERIERERISA
jgi:hypothetical protein